MRAMVERVLEVPTRDAEIDVLATGVRESARKLREVLPTQGRDVGAALENIQDPAALADAVASDLQISTEQKQAILEILDVRDRLRRVYEIVSLLGEGGPPSLARTGMRELRRDRVGLRREAASARPRRSSARGAAEQRRAEARRSEHP